MRRLILLVIAATACDLGETPTAPPTASSTPVLPLFSFTGGSGKVLGSTNQGELVEIDLDDGTVTLIGDAGAFGGDSVGWTDIAFDGSGKLYALSRFLSESDFVPHLYEIDPSNGGVISDIGSAGDHALSELDYDTAGFYGSGRDDPFGCCGQLFTIDESSAQVTWISSDTLGYGLNPYDTASSGSIAHGGFAVHPVTGDLWGIEALQSLAPVVYRVDPTTGLADSILRLGLGGVEASSQYGFDGLHILDDGTFIATRGGGFVAADSVLWEISSVPDPVSGLAEIAVIPLTYIDALQGHVNGLEAVSATPDTADIVLTLTADTTELHPWIRSDTIPIGDTVKQVQRVADTTTVILTATAGDAPAAGQVVELTAEFLHRTGGHHHLDDRLAFTDVPLVAGQDAAGRPRTGYFKQGNTRTASLTDTTDANGEITFAFVAGFIGGDVEIIAATGGGGTAAADSLPFRIRVPGLVDLQDKTTAFANGYFIGQVVYGTSPPDTVHAQDSIWSVTPSFADSLALVIQAMQTDSVGQEYYLQINDASLPFGGAFTVDPDTTTSNQTIERVFSPHNGHVTHALGIDVDVAYCYAKVAGEDGQANRVMGTDCESQGSIPVNAQDLMEAAHSRGLLIMAEGDHYHLRLPEQS